jgi:hypothetical protein
VAGVAVGTVVAGMAAAFMAVASMAVASMAADADNAFGTMAADRSGGQLLTGFLATRSRGGSQFGEGASSKANGCCSPVKHFNVVVALV